MGDTSIRATIKKDFILVCRCMFCFCCSGKKKITAYIRFKGGKIEELKKGLLKTCHFSYLDHYLCICWRPVGDTWRTCVHLDRRLDMSSCFQINNIQKKKNIKTLTVIRTNVRGRLHQLLERRMTSVWEIHTDALDIRIGVKRTTWTVQNLQQVH